MFGEKAKLAYRSHGLWRVRKDIEAMLQIEMHVLFTWSSIKNFDGVTGWGHKSNTRHMRAKAEVNRIPYIALEDGFIRSFSLGVQGDRRLSIIFDDVGIYYNAFNESRLERLIGEAAFDEKELAEAQEVRRLIAHHEISKYNSGINLDLPKSSLRRVLVIDQTYDDMSVRLSGAGNLAFINMLDDAVSENPDSEIFIKIHPDVLTGLKKGYLVDFNKYSNVKILAENYHPLHLLKQFSKVYTVCSQMGFEALILDVPCVCYGWPWYSGWGLTIDRAPLIPGLDTRRLQRRTVLQLMVAAYFKYSRYLNPVTGKQGNIFDVIDYLARLKRLRGIIGVRPDCSQLSSVKRAYIDPFIKGIVQKKPSPTDRISANFQWGSVASGTFDGTPITIEDGFLRSVGLGVRVNRPYSLVFDKAGIYYDAYRESDLEIFLQNHVFLDSEVSRANELIKRLVHSRISKYNVGAGMLVLPESAKNRHIILIPGQVESDASIARGSPDIKSNYSLAQRVRTQNPAAFIIYKPHPDVVTGVRKSGLREKHIAELVDLEVVNVSISDCINLADEVHTLTSLAGFEALLFGRPVTCYGQPFYSGWGLTKDQLPLLRRQRQLTLEELVYGALIAYPFYIDPKTQTLTTVESLIAYFEEQLALAHRPDVDRKGRWFNYVSRWHAAIKIMLSYWF